MKDKSIWGKATNSGMVEVQTSGLTGAGDHGCKPYIIPVKSSKGQRAVETYAFLDPGIQHVSDG